MIEEMVVKLKPFLDNEILSEKLEAVTDDDIEVIENKLSLVVTDELRCLLKSIASNTYSGGILLQSASKNAPNFLNTVIQTLKAREIGVNRNAVVICQDNGNYYCVTEDGTVALWEYDIEDFGEEWDDICDWIENEWLPRIS